VQARGVGWLTGFSIGVVAACAVPDDLFPGGRIFLFGPLFLIFGLLGEWVQARSERAAFEEAALQRDQRSADGRVELVGLGAFRGEPNPFNAAIFRYEPGDIGGDEFAAAPVGSGRCPPLLGRVVVVSLFLGRDGRTWSDSEVAESYEALFRGISWLEREAQRYGARVNVDLARVYFVADDDDPDEVLLGFVRHGDEVGPFEQEAATKALTRATRAAAALGFHDATELFGAVARASGADTTVWLLHPREAGRSFAIPPEFHAPGNLNLAVFYPREASFPEPLAPPARADPVTVVHELLHLFGASDKYGTPLSSFAPQTVTSREVMRLSEERLSRLRIDPRTAAEIGWLTRLDDGFL
jgi:hypothetical protein